MCYVRHMPQVISMIWDDIDTAHFKAHKVVCQSGSPSNHSMVCRSAVHVPEKEALVQHTPPMNLLAESSREDRVIVKRLQQSPENIFLLRVLCKYLIVSGCFLP